MALRHVVDDRDTVNGLRRLLDRVDHDELAREILLACERQIGGLARMPDEIRWGPARDTVLEVIGICRRCLLGSIRPTPDDMRLIEESTRQRAAEGLALEDILRAYRLGVRLSWRNLRTVADPGDESVLMVAAEAMLTFVEVITGVVTRAYLDERFEPVAERERNVRQLLVALDEDGPLSAAQIDTAEAYGLRPGGPFLPFAVVVDGGPEAHDALAERFRQHRVLAVSEGRRTLGLCVEADEIERVLADRDALCIIGHPIGPGRISSADRALRAALTAGAGQGRRGMATVTEFAPDVFLAVAPDLADALDDRVVGVLPADLRVTLEALVDNNFDRAATSAELGIHRNTLLHRTARISELTGADLSTLPGQVTAYMAIRRREQRARTSARVVPSPTGH
jgi:hypothetical protein